MRIRRICAIVALPVLAGLWGLPAQAASFSPKSHFSLSTYKVTANPKVTYNVSQAAGQENISKVTIVVPAGFKLPGDAAIKNGEILGSGQIKIATQPACTAASEGTFNASLTEKDRTPKQKSHGVKAVWLLDLSFTQIELDLYGSLAAGWKVKANVPSSQATCPPFSFRTGMMRLPYPAITSRELSVDPSSTTITSVWG